MLDETKTQKPFPQFIDKNPRKHFHWSLFLVISFALTAALLISIQNFKTYEEIDSMALGTPIKTKSMDKSNPVKLMPTKENFIKFCQENQPEKNIEGGYYSIRVNNEGPGGEEFSKYFSVTAEDVKGRTAGNLILGSNGEVGIYAEEIPGSVFRQLGRAVDMSLIEYGCYVFNIYGKQNTGISTKLNYWHGESENGTVYYYQTREPKILEDLIMINPKFHAVMLIPKNGFESPPDLLVDENGDGSIDKIIKGTK